MAEQMTAHLTKTKDGYELYISHIVRQADWVHCWRVAGKRQAREMAKKYNAKPWNF